MRRGVKALETSRRSFGVVRRVHEDHEPTAVLIRRHHLEHGAVGRAESLGIAMGGVDIGEATQGVEIVFGVVVHRLLVAQPSPDGVRIRLVGRIQRIPGQRGRLGRGHGLENWGNQRAVAANSSSVKAITCS